MNKKNLTFGVCLKAKDTETGVIEAIVSVFGNLDSYKEVVRLGAFSESLERKLPKGVWMHRWDQPVAKTLEARELAPGDPLLPEKLSALGGLYIRGQFNLETQRGKEAFSDVAFGTVDEFSIGYSVDAYEYDKETGVTTLTKVSLFEWSPVLVGANPATALISAKDFEGGWPQGLTPEKQVELLLAGARDLKARFATFESDRKQGLSDDRIADCREVAAELIALADSCKRSATADEVRLLEVMRLETELRLGGHLTQPRRAS
jgi:HK97 family phage prohead protease